MPEFLSPAEAVARVRTTDSIGLPLGPAQPAAFLEALGPRKDWADLRLYGALVTVLSEVFNHPNVHYLSGFFGPLERILRDTGANIGFAPADFRRFAPMMERAKPRIMAHAVAPADADGWYSLSIHAGANVDEIHRAGADPERMLLVEVSDHFPRTYGWGDERHAVHADEIDIVVTSDREPYAFADPPPSDAEKAIAEHVRELVPDGATLQTGIGAVPNAVATMLAEGPGGDYGIHSEMFTNGLMRLHQAGKVTNRKGQYDGVSVATFAGGSAELYAWLDENHDVAFLPVDLVNSPEMIGRNRKMVTINGALAIDIQGQVVADTIGAEQYSGIGGHEDFVAGPALSLDSASLLCMPATFERNGKLQSRIVPWFPAGTVITTPRHQVDVVVTEYGAADLGGLTIHQRGMLLADLAHPDFRDELKEAAERASHGRSPLPKG